MAWTARSQWLSVTLRALAVFISGGTALGWLARAWWTLGRDLVLAGPATGLVEVTLESLVVEVAGVVLLVAVTVLASSACLTALDSLVMAVAGRRFKALTRISRSSCPPWWRRVVLLLRGAGLSTCVSATATYADERDPSDGCRVDCADIEGLSLPDLPARTAVPPTPTSRDRQTAVVVVPGDCLWDIARDELGPRVSDAEVAVRVDAWLAHNRDILGPDPDLIFPGTHLELPEVQK